MTVVAALFTFGALVIGVLSSLVWPLIGLAFDGRRSGHLYSIPSQSMMPSLIPGDRIIPRQLSVGEPMRGEVVVYRRTMKDVRVARVAAVGGDKIALNAGVPWINGVAARRRDLGEGPTVENKMQSRLYAERLPGERGSHRILKVPIAPFDDFPETKVPPGKLFLLGDNRDQAADSRYAIADMGAGLVAVGQVLGIVDYVAWSTVKGRMARPIDKPVPITLRQNAKR
jgi:signal peptidase I